MAGPVAREHMGRRVPDGKPTLAPKDERSHRNLIRGRDALEYPIERQANSTRRRRATR